MRPSVFVKQGAWRREQQIGEYLKKSVPVKICGDFLTGRLEGIKQLIRVMEGGFGNISHIKFTNEGTWSSKAL